MEASDGVGRALIIYGGSGLGAGCVSYFKSQNWWVCSVDSSFNQDADFNILIPSLTNTLVLSDGIEYDLQARLNNLKLDAVICVTDGFVEDVQELRQTAPELDVNMEWYSSICTLEFSTIIATQYLKVGGLLTIISTDLSFLQTSEVNDYRLTVDILDRHIRMILDELPINSSMICIFPIIRPFEHDCPWTPLEMLSALMWTWSINQDRPHNGAYTLVISNE